MKFRFNNAMANRFGLVIMLLIVMITGCAIVKKQQESAKVEKPLKYNGQPYPIIIGGPAIVDTCKKKVK